MEANDRWRAMGCDIHVVVNGPSKFANFAARRIDDLENKWSRFLPYSEITKLNNANGETIQVSRDTQLLVQRALEGYKLTNGIFDPTILGDLIRLGYGKSFDQLSPELESESELLKGAADIVHTPSGNVTLPAGVGFDPGGIGKGLTADIVASEIMEAGADGVLINVGGDIRVMGEPAESGDWKIEIFDIGEKHVDTVALSDGAIATSTTKKRTWSHAGTTNNHIIDPTSGQNPTSTIKLGSVLSANCWQAEILTKCLMIGEISSSLDFIEGLGSQAFAIDENDSKFETRGWKNFQCQDVTL